MELSYYERLTFLNHFPFPEKSGYKGKLMRKEILKAISLNTEDLEYIEYEETPEGMNFDREKMKETTDVPLEDRHVEYMLKVLKPKALEEDDGLTDEEFLIFEKLGGIDWIED